MEKVYSPYGNVLKVIKEAVDILGYTDSDIEAIKYPERELKVMIPVWMDNGTTKVFGGYRVQHSTPRGPAKDGVCFHPAVDPSEAKALAAQMTFKHAVVNVLYGGSKGGAVYDPNELSENGIRTIIRRYVAVIVPPMGPEQDIPAPDVGTSTSAMSWMMDTYSMLKGRCIHDMVTGKPTCLGGALGKNETTGWGVIYTTKNIPNKMGIPAEGTAVITQGMGNVGSITAKLLREEGMKITAVSNVPGGIYNPDGFNVPAILDYFSLSRKNLSKDYNEGGMSRITNEELLEMDVRVLVLAALENQINASNAYKTRVEAIVEAASGPVVADADGMLQDGDITVVPDILANISGAMVSYLKQIQDIQSVSWTEEEVNRKLKDMMDPAFEAIWDIAMKQNATLRIDAYLITVKQVVGAKAVRAIWP